jgi:geranylgeranyl pyrophosphate synthase
MSKKKRYTKASQAPEHEKLVGKKLTQRVQQLFEERGKEAFEIARHTILKEAEKMEYRPLQEAFQYLAGYWVDTTRPALLSIACEAVGGDPGATNSVAASLALICEAADIHDDIIDQSTRKKDHLTLYGKFGGEIAMLIGDALLFGGFTLLNEAEDKIPHEKMEKIMHLIKDLFFELGEAEALELSFRHRHDVKVEEYLSMVTKKAADVEAYLHISAILSNASEAETKALARYGRILGMLIILGDDNSDMLDEKEMINRARNESYPLPILYALQRPVLRRKLVPSLNEKMNKNSARDILDLVYEAGVFSDIEACMKSLISEGNESLRAITNRELLSQILRSTYPE